MSEKSPAYCEYLRIDKYNVPRCGYIPADKNAIQIPSGAQKEIYWLPICLPAKRVVSPFMIDLIQGKEVPLEQQPQAILEAQARECNCYIPFTPQVVVQNLDEKALEVEQSFSPFSETVDLATLLPGTSLEIFEGVTSLDTFTAFVVNRAKQQTALEKIRKRIPPSEKIIADVRARGFNGSLRNIRATIITNAFIPASELKTLTEEELFRFIVELDMHSSGRGTIGTYVADIGIISRGEKGNRPLLGITFRNLTGKKGLDAIDALLATSRGVWEETQRNALRNAVSAGLPSLGKRR